MIININESISNESFNKLLNGVNSLREYENILVYFNSEGGDVESMEAIIDLINQHYDKFELVANGKIYSAAFIIFYRVHCRKRVLPGTIGMAHYIRVGIHVNEERQGYYEADKAMLDWVEKQNEWTIALYKSLKLTKQELNLLKASREVYFSTERLNELLKNAESN